MFGLGKNTADATIRVKYKGDEAKKGLSSLQKTIATVITVAAIKQVASYTYEMGKLGAQAKLVEKNFEGFARQAGQTSEQALGKLRKATMGMISDMELQQKAMQAMIGGVSFDAIITSMEYVSKFALATGTDVSEKMRTTMTGLARGSAAFLDDIGIQVMGSKDVVNDAIKQMQEKMGQFAIAEDDAAIASAKLKSELENQKALIGKELLPAWTALTNWMASKAVPTFGSMIRELLRMNKAIFTGYTLDDAKIDRIIELAQQTKNMSIVEAELTKQLDKQNKIRREMQQYELAHGDLPAAKKVMEDYRKELAVTTEQIVKLGKAKREIESGSKGTGIDTTGTKPTTATATTGATTKKEQEDAFSAWLPSGSLMEGFQEGLEERNAIQQEEDAKLAEQEQAMIEQRIALQQQYKISTLGEEEYYYQERITKLKEYYDAGILSAEEYNRLLSDANEEHRKSDLRKEEEYYRQKINMAQNMVSSIDTINGAMMQISDAQTQKQIKNLDKLGLSEKEYEKQKEKLLEEGKEKRKAFARVQQGIAIAEATINAFKMGVGAGADATGGPIVRALSVAAAIATGMAQVAMIEAQHFQTGRIGNSKRGRQADNIMAAIGEGETIVPAPQSAQHEDLLRSIVNNTANTKSMSGGGQASYNFYGASTEQILNVITQSKRTNAIGMKI